MYFIYTIILLLLMTLFYKIQYEIVRFYNEENNRANWSAIARFSVQLLLNLTLITNSLAAEEWGVGFAGGNMSRGG